MTDNEERLSVSLHLHDNWLDTGDNIQIAFSSVCWRQEKEKSEEAKWRRKDVRGRDWVGEGEEVENEKREKWEENRTSNAKEERKAEMNNKRK